MINQHFHLFTDPLSCLIFTAPLTRIMSVHIVAQAVRRGVSRLPRIPTQLVMVLEQDEDDPSWFVVTVEKVPGIVSQGKGITEAVANGLEAISAFLGSLAKDGFEVPKGLSVVTKVLSPA